MKTSLLITSILASLTAQAAPCPAEFFQIPLYPEAGYCQSFSDKLPATLSFHANANMQEVAAFYQQKLGKAEHNQMHKGRLELSFKQGQQVLVLSKDGNGTQVAILVKAPQKGQRP